MNKSSAKANFGSIRGEVRDTKVGRKNGFLFGFAGWV